MTKTIYSVGLLVQDYLDENLVDDFDDARDDAFFQAQEAVEDATRLAEEELRGLFPDGSVTVIEGKFVEFDSGKVSHAGAHFEFEVEGISQADLDSKIDL